MSLEATLPPEIPNERAFHSQEMTEQIAPHLYEQFLGTEVTVFGMTGTLEELGDLCPVPPEQRSPEAMDRFAAKVLQEAGVEIPAAFAHLREPQLASKDQPGDKTESRSTEEASTPRNSAPKREILTSKVTQVNEGPKISTEHFYD